MTSADQDSNLNPEFPEHLLYEKGYDPRNIIDHYKYWETEAIKVHLAAKATPLICVVEHHAMDFNFSVVVRNSNAFGVSEVYSVGRKKWDRRGSVGTENYTPVSHLATNYEYVMMLEAWSKAGYDLIAVDNVEGAIPVSEHVWNPKSVLIFGQESIGLSNFSLKAADKIVYIKQSGSVRSLNIAVASGIVMYDYSLKIGNQ